MYLTMMMMMLTTMISIIIMKISLMISMKFKLNMEKMSPFECGFNPMFYKRMPFSIRFFLITIMFLIFDIEISLILPLIFSTKMSNLMIWYSSSTLFMLILILGLFYEWKFGALNWM